MNFKKLGRGACRDAQGKQPGYYKKYAVAAVSLYRSVCESMCSHLQPNCVGYVSDDESCVIYGNTVGDHPHAQQMLASENNWNGPITMGGTDTITRTTGLGDSPISIGPFCYTPVALKGIVT